MSHADSIMAELSLSKIEIRSERYKSLLKSQKEKLSYLAQRKITKISDKLRIKKPGSLQRYFSKISHNPTYNMRLSQIRSYPTLQI